MRIAILIFLLISFAARSQDKVFFSSGLVKKGIVVSIAKDAVFFKDTDTSATQRFKKTDLVMVEKYDGVRFIFAKEDNNTEKETAVPLTSYKKNSIGVQPLGIFVGRGTIVYERYAYNGRVGFVFPVSVTFDPIGSLYNSRVDTNKNAPKRISGVNFIAGADVNFYLGQDDFTRLFVGPRLRYGTDLFLRGIEAYSLQTQVGLRMGSPDEIFSQHLSVGFGFVNVISTFTGPLVHPKQFYGWFSVNYRLGIGW